MDKLLELRKNSVEDSDEEDETPFDKLREECDGGVVGCSSGAEFAGGGGAP